MSAQFTRCNIDGDYSLNIPSSLNTIELLGSTG